MAKKKTARSAPPARAGKVRSLKRYGWTPDLPDQRDRMYSAPLRRLGALPPSVDLRNVCPPVVDQGELGSCTANAIAGALQFNQMKEKLADIFPPSRLFIYYNERVIEHTVNEDSGAMIRDGIKSVAKDGAPHETLWPYDISKFRDKPSAAAYKDAAKHRAILYQRLNQTLDQLKGCLASGFPFVFGFSVYESFETQAVAKTGKVPMPKAKEKQLGGHAVLAVGYDDASKRFIVRNSWGTGWGLQGYFTIPYAYLTDGNLADDFWTIKQV
ncbi:MAG: C1 family peptidase [Acidobacteriota bacterium]